MPSPPCNDTNPHEVISSYFIGPKAENLPVFQENLITILNELKNTRLAYHENDEVFISKEVRESKTFEKITKRFNEALKLTAKLMGEHSIPFWHPRYEGHMTTDLTMPGLLGYAATMMFNPNNVTVEASPFTTVVEHKAGKQLCKMFGYNTNRDTTPTAWGHITCDGTVANLESIWVARNLKFYPLSLRRAMKKGPLGFIADDKFKVPNCLGTMKPFKDLTLWELLNLRPDIILGIANTLYEKYGITSKYLEDSLRDHSIQTIGKDALEREFGLEKQGQYFLAKTRHYSWPKGGAIAGLGSGNMQGIELDLDGHIDLENLKEKLEICLKEEQPVYAVVAVMGSTEEGAADRLSKIIELREKFRNKGLSFLVHADAAWGGYFASMIPPEVKKGPGDGKKAIDKVPSLPLRKDTLTDFMALKHADSITVDPHKAGYIPYPAGGLVYRDERLRFLVTWTSPYLTQGSLESIGVYGVEGSKPGAAAMGTWLSNQTIGLDENGYGRLLGEAAFTSARLSAHYAAMHWKQPLDEDTGKRRYICIPFNRLPKEKEGEGYDSLDSEVDKRREWINDNILDKPNEEIVHNPEIMDYLRELGSDLNVNAFALNWYREDGSINDEIEEANYLMKRVVDQLSITKADQDPRNIPLYLTSTQFEPDLYGTCALHFMKRLHLIPAKQDLFVLRNVVMSPFPTEKNFIGDLMDYLQTVITNEVKETLWPRNRPGSYHVSFLMYGTDEIFLDFLTSFHQATQRQQIILSADLDSGKKEDYAQLKKDNPLTEIAWISDKEEDIKATILEMLADGHPVLKGWIAVKDKETGEYVRRISDCQVTLNRIVKSRPLNSPNREPGYPEDFMPFYLYGTPAQPHISHMLLRAPNISLSASNVKLNLDHTQAVNDGLPNGLILTLSDWREVAMQPFPATNDEICKGTSFFFRKDNKFNVKVFEDPRSAHDEGPGLLVGLKKPIAQGTMTLGDDVRVDVEGPNKDPFDNPPPPSTKSWEDELDKVKAVLNGKQIVCEDGTKLGG